MPMPSLSSVAASHAFVAHVLGDAVSMFGKSVVCLKMGNLLLFYGHSNAKMMINILCIWMSLVFFGVCTLFSKKPA